MTLIHSPQTVLDGLVLYVDPANPKSYAGTGTSLLDLSGSVNNGTISGATFSSSNLGYFSFNGTSDYVYIPNSTSLRPTVAMSGEAFAYRENWNITTVRKIFSKTQSAGYSMDLNTVAGNIGASIRIGSIYIYASSPRTDLSSGWHHFAFTFDGRYFNWYVDGVNKNTYDHGSTVAIFQNTANLFIGAESAGVPITPAGNWWEGYISSVKIYNRALSEAEVQQNFRALKGRYGL